MNIQIGQKQGLSYLVNRWRLICIYVACGCRQLHGQRYNNMRSESICGGSIYRGHQNPQRCSEVPASRPDSSTPNSTRVQAPCGCRYGAWRAAVSASSLCIFMFKRLQKLTNFTAFVSLKDADIGKQQILRVYSPLTIECTSHPWKDQIDNPLDPWALPFDIPVVETGPTMYSFVVDDNRKVIPQGLLKILAWESRFWSCRRLYKPYCIRRVILEPLQE